MIEKRAEVKEWRVTRTTQYQYVGVPRLVARFWVEADPVYGGMADPKEVEHYIDALFASEPIRECIQFNSPGLLCHALFDSFPAANSVEVCNVNGFGVALHRDWP